MVQWLGPCDSRAGAQVQSLVRGLRSHLLHRTASTFFFLMGPNMWAWEHLVPNYTRLPRFLLCPPPVGQGSGTKEKFLVLLVLGLLISWVPSTWHHSFGTQAIQGLGGHRTPQLPRMPGAGGPSDAVADACAGSSRGGWRPLSPLLPLFLPR